MEKDWNKERGDLKALYLQMGFTEEDADARAELEVGWAKSVWERNDGKCTCGEVKGVNPVQILPSWLGGQLVPENGILYCPSCLRKKEEGVSKYVMENWGQDTVRMQFLCPRSLHVRVGELAQDQKKSIATVLRELLAGWVGAHDSRPAVQQLMEKKERER